MTTGIRIIGFELELQEIVRKSIIYGFWRRCNYYITISNGADVVEEHGICSPFIEITYNEDGELSLAEEAVEVARVISGRGIHCFPSRIKSPE